MASSENGRLGDASDEADLAKAFQAIAQGEQTASQLENHLTALESRIEELLKQANDNDALATSLTAQEAAASNAGDATQSAPNASDEK